MGDERVSTTQDGPGLPSNWYGVIPETTPFPRGASGTFGWYLLFLFQPHPSLSSVSFDCQVPQLRMLLDSNRLYIRFCLQRLHGLAVCSWTLDISTSEPLYAILPHLKIRRVPTSVVTEF